MVQLTKLAIILGIIAALIEQSFIIWYFASSAISSDDSSTFCAEIHFNLEDLESNRKKHDDPNINFYNKSQGLTSLPFPVTSTELYYMFVLVNSKPENTEMRNAMRESWLKTKTVLSKKIGYLFFIGSQKIPENLTSQIIEEHKQHNDLVLLDKFDNSFSMNTEKVLEIMVWTSYRIKSQFFLKAEDGTYVIFERIIEVMGEKRFPKESVVLGNFVWKRPVNNEADNEPNWYLCNDNYLPYPLTQGYIISEDMLKYFAKFADIFQIYNHDDISLGVWTIGLDIQRIDDKRIIPSREQCNDLSFIFYSSDVESLNSIHYLWSEKNNIKC